MSSLPKTSLREYSIYADMKSRCYNSSCKAYKHYGARGIKISPRWLESFDNFFEDMGLRPSPKHSLDRIDTNGDYNSENCRWATRRQQAINMRIPVNRTSEYRGVCWDSSRKKYLASIKYHYGFLNLGRFSNEEEAALAYDGAAIQLNGLEAHLNILT